MHGDEGKTQKPAAGVRMLYLAKPSGCRRIE